MDGLCRVAHGRARAAKAMDGLCRVAHGRARATKAINNVSRDFEARGRELRFAGPENRVGYLTKPGLWFFNCVQ